MLNMFAAASFAGVRVMYRVALLVFAGLVLAACSMNTGPISTGYAENPSDTGSITRMQPYPGGSSSKRTRRKSARNTRVAAINDKAPSGTYQTPTQGALSGRDYSRTTLQPSFARDLINQYRVENGLKPLKLNAELTAAAKAHARDLAKWDRISHYGSDGSNPWDRVKRAGYKARLAAENVGTGQTSFEEVLKGWKASEGHNKNLLLADAEHMGIALVQDPKTEFRSFWALVLGASM